jgi:hypothetical protein
MIVEDIDEGPFVDTIVEEIRVIRDEIAREHNYDLDSLFDMWQKKDAERAAKHTQNDLSKAK